MLWWHLLKLCCVGSNAVVTPCFSAPQSASCQGRIPGLQGAGYTGLVMCRW